tara:strand:- start:1923 stop:2051 length:129 start_codon:yes stop_codon:yes gene_type:complete
MKIKTIVYGLGLVFGFAILIALTSDKPTEKGLPERPAIQYIN